MVQGSHHAHGSRKGIFLRPRRTPYLAVSGFFFKKVVL
ncbi:hypothetical protein B4096_1702 [Heyndrickxia coagulans]|nr:hypothetical protein B4096_1702 [Heyndrickxia coagulans]